MSDDKKLSRGEFLGVIGGMVVTAALIKFSGAKKMLAVVTPEKKTALAPEPRAYGNHTYGGNKS